MQNKSLNVSVVLKGFDGTEMKKPDSKEPITLRDVLLSYLANSHAMNLEGKEEPANAYSAGVKIGTAKGNVILSQIEIATLKKLAEHNKVRTAQGEEIMFTLVVSQQIIDLLDGAENVKE
jgi:hypothetical protein